MELSARDSTNKIVAISMITLLTLLMLSLTSTIFLLIENRYLSTHREKIITPMAYDAPFVISESKGSAAYLQMMAMSFISLRLNVTPETVEAHHDFLLGYVKAGAQADFKVVLAQEAKQIRDNEVNSTFHQTQLQVYPDHNRVDIRGVLKTWIGNGQPQSDIKQYSLWLSYENGNTVIERFLEVNDDKV